MPFASPRSRSSESNHRRAVHTVYNQWTQFEEFPRFMAGVKEVRQLDDTHVHWHAEIWGKDKEWDAEIIEQVPDQRIAWRSTSGDAPNAGTRVSLTVMSGRVETTVKQFRDFIEKRGNETGGWRGEVHGGQKTPR